MRNSQGQTALNLDGDRIRALRTRIGWSQYDLAAKTGLSRAFIGDLELGNRRARKLAAEAIAKALGVSVADLVKNSS